MTSQELVVASVKRRMNRAFNRGDLALAANLSGWLSTMESMSAGEFTASEVVVTPA